MHKVMHQVMYYTFKLQIDYYSPLYNVLFEAVAVIRKTEDGSLPRQLILMIACPTNDAAHLDAEYQFPRDSSPLLCSDPGSIIVGQDYRSPILVDPSVPSLRPICLEIWWELIFVLPSAKELSYCLR